MVLTCRELLAIARQDRPHVRYARRRDYSAIAAWDGAKWTMVAALVDGPEWITVGDLSIRGVCTIPQSDWIED